MLPGGMYDLRSLAHVSWVEHYIITAGKDLYDLYDLYDLDRDMSEV